MDIPEGEPRYLDEVLQIPTREIVTVGDQTVDVFNTDEPLTTVEDGVWDPAEHGQKLVALTESQWQTVLDVLRLMGDVEFDDLPMVDTSRPDVLDTVKKDYDDVTQQYREVRDEIETQLAY